MNENAYQLKLVKRIRQQFPGCVVLKNDPQYQQGILDLTILHQNRWAMLEVKASSRSKLQPNQGYFIGLMDDMSFAALIHPDNEEEVLDALQQAFAL